MSSDFVNQLKIWGPIAAAALTTKAVKDARKEQEEYLKFTRGQSEDQRRLRNRLIARYAQKHGMDEDEVSVYMIPGAWRDEAEAKPWLAKDGGIMGLRVGGPISGPQSVGQSLTVNPGMSQSFVNTLTPHQQFSGYLNANQGIANLSQGGRIGLRIGGDPDDPAWGPPEITEGELLDFEETPPDLLDEEVMRETIETPEGIESIETVMSDGPIPGEESEEFLRYYKFFIQLGFAPDEAEEKAREAIARETEQVAMAPDPSEFNPLEQLMQQLEQQETPGQEPGMMEETETLGLEDILAKGGRPGYNRGRVVNPGGYSGDDQNYGEAPFMWEEFIKAQKTGEIPKDWEYEDYIDAIDVSPSDFYANGGLPGGADEIDILTEEWGNLDADQRAGYGDIETFRQSDHFKIILDNLRFKSAKGGRPGYARGSGIASIPKGHDLDLRDSGGFIPYGSKERADDVDARVSKNEFVMTADAVRAAGGGSVNKGAQRMYNLMNNLEARV